MSFSEVAKIISVTPMTDTVLVLILEPTVFIPYLAGQYLQANLGGEWLSFSIANAPIGASTYELHIRHTKAQALHRHLMELFKTKKTIDIRLPFGRCHLDCLAIHRPTFFIAGGTGFAPVKAMVESTLIGGESLLFHVIWCARSLSDVYMEDVLHRWEMHVKACQSVKVWVPDGERQDLMTYLVAFYEDILLHAQFVLAGPFQRVYGLRDALVSFGVVPSAIYSDAFEFEEKG